ncbi:MAG: DUF58 domain-containing protein [Chromatiales bacterium]|nr:DUF58 domain-containing protein [Chromatiales bacterium]
MALSTVLKRPLPTSMGRRKGALAVRLTAAGFWFIVLMLCGFLMSVNFSNNLVFAMTFLLVGIAAIGWWQTRWNLRGLAFGDWRCEPVFAGQPVNYKLALTNPSDSGRYGLQSSVIGGEWKQAVLPAQGQIELLLQRPTESRGVLQAMPAEIKSRFPLGLFEARLTTGMLPECLVYPAPRGVQPLPDQAQGQQAHQRRESGSFTEMRRYAPGDPLSRIAWQALARSDEIYTKEFDGAEGLPALWFTWDMVKAAGVEEKLSQLCRWVLDAQRQGREYGLDIPGVQISPASDDAHQRRCLKVLALYGAVTGSSD